MHKKKQGEVVVFSKVKNKNKNNLLEENIL
jgi:hypothetical protein